jgi:peptidoglycan/xylan/chitin deacetylase (PgdA/CDA1 family)
MNSIKHFLAMSIIVCRRVVYGALGMLDRVCHFRRPPVVIFCYHSIGTDNWRFTVSLDTLKRQMEVLLAYADPLTLSDVERYLDGTFTPTRPGFLVTFDDGYRDILSTVEFFRKHEIRPVVFALADPVRANRLEMENDKPLLTQDELLLLQSAGWEIGCHSATHASFSTLDQSDEEQEVRDAKILLERCIEAPVTSFAYPKGGYTESIVEKICEAGFRMAFTVEHGIVTAQSNKLLIPRVGVDQSHSLAEFSVMSTVWGIRLKECLAKLIGKFL